jgi:hypothetical protein
MHQKVGVVDVSWPYANRAKNSGPLHMHKTSIIPGSGQHHVAVFTHNFPRRPSFFIPMNRARLFGLMALTLLPVLYVAVIYRTTISVLGAVSMTEYLLPVSIFGAIWLAEAFAVCRNRLHPTAAR